MFSIAIAVPLVNHEFNQPTYFSATLTNAVAAGAVTIYLTASYPLFYTQEPSYGSLPLSTIIQRSDTLTLTSTHTSYSGYTEQVEVEKVEAYGTGGAKLYLKEPVSYAYLSGDAAKGYGSAFPENWSKSANSGKVVGSTSYADFFHTTITPPGGGYSDDYGFYFLAGKRDGKDTTAQSSFLLSQDFELPAFREYCWFREGMMIRASVSGGNTQFFLGAFSRQAMTGYQSHINSKYFKPTANNVWEEVTSVFRTAPNLSRYANGTLIRTDRYGNVSIGVYLDAAIYSYAWACVDDIYLEHIRGVAPLSQSMTNISVPTTSTPVYILVHNPSDFTVGRRISVWGRYNSGNAMEGEINFSQATINAISDNYLVVTFDSSAAGYTWASGAMIEEANQGYYTFEEYPDQNVSWDTLSNVSMSRSTNNGLKMVNPSGWGERTTKVQVNMHFTNVSYTFYRKLRKFEDACKRGELLNLHQDLSSQDLPELKKPFVQGIMQLSGFTHDMWNREVVSFNLNFLEV